MEGSLMQSNPTRVAIMAFMEARPESGWITAGEVCPALEVKAQLSAVAYHLAILAENGLLKRDDSQPQPRFQLA